MESYYFIMLNFSFEFIIRNKSHKILKFYVNIEPEFIRNKMINCKNQN